MHRRYDAINIPIELLRTLVAISELGTFTKAADALKLTQPAISAQVKRLQQIVGAEILEKWSGGVRATPQGDLVGKYARRILAINDQILQHSRFKSYTRAVRIGLSPVLPPSVLARVFTALGKIDAIANFQIECSRYGELWPRLSNGYIDVAVLPVLSAITINPETSWRGRMVWVCAPDFLLSPGKPVPLIGWPGTISHQTAIDALDRAGLRYTLTFTADDSISRAAALQAGLGYMVLPERAVDPSWKIATEHFLPPLPEQTTGVFVRDDAYPGEFAVVTGALVGVLAPEILRTAAAAAPGTSNARTQPGRPPTANDGTGQSLSP